MSQAMQSYCGKCGYSILPSTIPDTTYTKCPQCGGPWRSRPHHGPTYPPATERSRGPASARPGDWLLGMADGEERGGGDA